MDLFRWNRQIDQRIRALHVYEFRGTSDARHSAIFRLYAVINEQKKIIIAWRALINST